MTDTQPGPAGAEGARPRRRPPEGKRFQPGQSGNPKGGPRRPGPRAADIEWIFNKTFEVVIDGENQRLPLGRALLLMMAHKALKGDAKAAMDLLALQADAEKTRAAEAAARAEAARARETRRREAELAARRAEERQAFEDEVDDDCLSFCEALAEVDAVATLDGRPVVQPWVLQAAMARDPGLLARLRDKHEDFDGKMEALGIRFEPG